MELYRLQSFKEYLEKELKETNKSISDHSIKHFDINDAAFVWWKYGPIKVKITDVYFDGKYYSYLYEEEDITFIHRMKEKLSYYYWYFFKSNKEPYLPDIKFGCGSYINAGEGLYKTEHQAKKSIIIYNLINAIVDYLDYYYAHKEELPEIFSLPEQIKDIDPDFQKTINENFWKLI